MQKSESVKNIAMALSQFLSKVTNPENSANNPFFNSKYAPLNEILNLVRPVLAEYGLSVMQSASSSDGNTIAVSTLVLHSSGEWIETDPLVLKAEKATAQGAGSAITYGRRYSLAAALGISGEGDDDGNHASGQKQEPDKQTQKPAESETKYHCKSCNKEIPKKVFDYQSLGLCYDCQKDLKKTQ